jgi:putative protein kinase ArgK-like GTPase of G3E family
MELPMLVINKADKASHRPAVPAALPGRQLAYTHGVGAACHDLFGNGHRITEVWEMICSFREQTASGDFETSAAANAGWFAPPDREILEQRFRAEPVVRNRLPVLEQQVLRGEITPYAAATRLFAEIG